MRVALDVSALSDGLQSGTAVYLYRLAEALAGESAIELDLLYNGMRGTGVELARSLEAPRVRVLVEPLLWRPLPAPLFWRPYPRALTDAARRADVFHVGEFVYPGVPPSLAVTATVHDCTTKLFPQWHGWANRLLHHRRLRWIHRHAKRVLIDAEATRADSARVMGLPPDRFDVVPLARGTPDVTPHPQVRAELGIGAEPFLLFVGTLEPRKNLVRLVEAFLRTPHAATTKLVLAGRWGWHGGELRQALDAAPPGRVVVTGGVGAGSLAGLYREARAFAYPSLYEGFGLPVLEAMAAGVPVITSGGGTLAEIAGGAARLVDASSVESIRQGLDEVLSSEELRKDLRAKGEVRERQFTWQRTARLTVDAWRRAAGVAA